MNTAVMPCFSFRRRALLRMFSSVRPGVSSIQICESCRLSQAASSAR